MTMIANQPLMNGVQYNNMNKTGVISKVMTEDTTITNMEELMDATEEQQSFYHDNDLDECRECCNGRPVKRRKKTP